MKIRDEKQEVYKKMEKNDYIDTFLADDGDLYGLRAGRQEDAEELVPMFVEAYGKDYIYPWIYKPDLLRPILLKKHYFWLVAEVIETGEICGVGLIEKRDNAAYAGKMVFKKKFHGKGLARQLGSKAIFYCFNKIPEFKNTLKLYSEVRTVEINAQKMIEKAGSIPYAFLPLFINFGERDGFDFSKGKPYIDGVEESAIFYFLIFAQLWKMRDPEVFLLDNEDVKFFYNSIRNYNKKLKRMMKNDTITYVNPTINIKTKKGYKPKEDKHIAYVEVEGIFDEKTIREILDRYSDWRIITLKIPICKESPYSVKTSLENGFNVVGYDVGSYLNEKGQLHDSILLCAFPNGVDFASFEKMDILEETQPLANKVKESLRNSEKIFIRNFIKFMNFDINDISLNSMNEFSDYIVEIYKFKPSFEINNLICSLETFLENYDLREKKTLRVLDELLSNLHTYHELNQGKRINTLLRERLFDLIKDLDVEILPVY